MTKKVESPVEFIDFYQSKNELLEKATLEYCKVLADNNDLEVDTMTICDILDYAYSKLSVNKIDVCYPFYDENYEPCYTGGCECKICPYIEQRK